VADASERRQPGQHLVGVAGELSHAIVKHPLQGRVGRDPFVQGSPVAGKRLQPRVRAALERFGEVGAARVLDLLPQLDERHQVARAVHHQQRLADRRVGITAVPAAHDQPQRRAGQQQHARRVLGQPQLPADLGQRALRSARQPAEQIQLASRRQRLRERIAVEDQLEVLLC
jgi:hypothetical protein